MRDQNQMQKLSHSFIKYSASSKLLKPRTLENYARCLSILRQFLSFKNISIEQLNIPYYTELLEHIRSMPRPRASRLHHLWWSISDSSVRNIVIILRMFLKYCNSIWVKTLHHDLVVLPKQKDVKLLPLSRDQLTRVIKAPSLFENDRRLALRNECLFRLWYSTGIRVQEALDITCEDVMNYDWSIYVLWKGAQSRNVMLSDDLLDMCRQYYNMRRDSDQEFLFVGHSHKKAVKKLTRWWVTYSLHKYRDYVWTKVTYHQLRHTFATHLFEAGERVPTIQRLMWHRSPEATLRYISVNNNVLRDAVWKLEYIQ